MSYDKSVNDEAKRHPGVHFFDRKNALHLIDHLRMHCGVAPKRIFDIIELRKAGARIVVGTDVSRGGVKAHPEKVKFAGVEDDDRRVVFYVVDGYVDGKELENLSLNDRRIGQPKYLTPLVVCIAVDSRTPGIPVMGIQIRPPYMAMLA
jgi:hypothetical protein